MLKKGKPGLHERIKTQKSLTNPGCKATNNNMSIKENIMLLRDVGLELLEEGGGDKYLCLITYL